MSLKSFAPSIVVISILPCAPLSATTEANKASSASIFANFVLPTIVSIVPQLALSRHTAQAYKNAQLGLDIYRGIQCFVLGARGLQSFYEHFYSEKSTDAEIAVAKEKDLSLNQDMFGYLLADTLVLVTLAEWRLDLFAHHLIALTVWGTTLAYGVLPDIIAMNTAAEFLSTFKGLESAVKGNVLCNKNTLLGQRILKTTYGFRMFVAVIRTRIWIFDWKVPEQRYEELGPLGYTVFRALNIAILGLETLWFYQTAKAFANLRFR